MGSKRRKAAFVEWPSGSTLVLFHGREDNVKDVVMGLGKSLRWRVESSKNVQKSKSGSSEKAQRIVAGGKKEIGRTGGGIEEVEKSDQFEAE